jgi:hypothetical protein
VRSVRLAAAAGLIEAPDAAEAGDWASYSSHLSR